jgi:hypothetical protein
LFLVVDAASDRATLPLAMFPREIAEHNCVQSFVVNGGANEMSFDRQLDLLIPP